MNVYADSSALVKRYVKEAGTPEAVALTDRAKVVATSTISRAEISAALARAVRMRILNETISVRMRRRFRRDWPDYVQIPVTEALVERADDLAWEHRLRGYDAVQLASALLWRASIGEDIVVATFDRELWEAAAGAGFEVWPAKPTA